MMKRPLAALRLIGVGFYIAICIVGGVALGLWLDRVTHTNLIFTLLGLVVGLLFAFVGVYRMLLPVIKEGQGKDRENS